MKNSKILEIIEKSGNNFHLKVGDFFKSNGWQVILSQYYPDPVTGKNREIDIVATKKYRVADSDTYVTLRLFIECKYVKDVNAFWFESKDIEKSRELAMDNDIMRDFENYNFSLDKSRTHHYLENKDVAILNAKAGKSDILYDGGITCVNCLSVLKGDDYAQYYVDYPLVVLDSFNNIFKVNKDLEGEEYTDIKDNFQLAINYPFKINKRTINKYYLVDIVSFELLESFLEKIENNDISIIRDAKLEEIKEKRNREYRENNERLMWGEDDNSYDVY